MQRSRSLCFSPSRLPARLGQNHFLAQRNPGSWFSEFKRGKLVRRPPPSCGGLDRPVFRSCRVRWPAGPKEQPSTWYSQYKRGSLVRSGLPARGPGLASPCMDGPQRRTCSRPWPNCCGAAVTARLRLAPPPRLDRGPL